MRAGETDVGARYCGHPDKVVGAREESGEAGGERDPVAYAHPHGRRDHLLLGDEHLEVASGKLLGELLGLGGVADLAVEGDYVLPGATQRLEGRAVGPAGRLLIPHIPGRQLQPARQASGEILPRARVGLAYLHQKVVAAAEFLERRLLLVFRHRFAVHAVHVFQERDPASLLGLRDDQGRRPGLFQRLCVGLVDLFGVVAVDLDRSPAEGLGAGGVVVAVPAVHRLAGLAEAVHVQDGREVVELVEGGVLEGLPHRTLRHLGVAAKHPDTIGESVQVLAGEGHADPYGQSLAQRPRGHVYPGDLGRRVSLQAAAELAERHELLVRDRARRFIDGVEQRGGVAFGEDEVVVVGVFGVVEVVAEVLAQEHGQQVGRRHGRGGVSRPGARARTDAIDPELLGETVPLLGPRGLLVDLLGHHLPPRQDRSWVRYYSYYPAHANRKPLCRPSLVAQTGLWRLC